MSKSDGFFVRPKFPVVEQDPSVQPQQAPQQEPMTLEQINAMIASDLKTAGVILPEKCEKCESLGICATLFVLGLK
jgi:hypothetical protein